VGITLPLVGQLKKVDQKFQLFVFVIEAADLQGLFHQVGTDLFRKDTDSRKGEVMTFTLVKPANKKIFLDHPRPGGLGGEDDFFLGYKIPEIFQSFEIFPTELKEGIFCIFEGILKGILKSGIL
jgi:hypothetical protein